MKAILEFNLPEESYEYNAAREGTKYRGVLWELEQWMRAKLKFEDLSDGAYDAIKETREQLQALLQDENIDIYE
jgi:hypothetical protein